MWFSCLIFFSHNWYSNVFFFSPSCLLVCLPSRRLPHNTHGIPVVMGNLGFSFFHSDFFCFWFSISMFCRFWIFWKWVFAEDLFLCVSWIYALRSVIMVLLPCRILIPILSYTQVWMLDHVFVLVVQRCIGFSLVIHSHISYLCLNSGIVVKRSCFWTLCFSKLVLFSIFFLFGRIL